MATAIAPPLARRRAPVGAAAAGLSPRAARRLGVLVGLVTCACYLPGLGRAIDLDGAETVSFFVVTPSWFDPLFTQREFNNPPLFSFLEHVVYVLTGRSDAATMRLLPILCAGIAVALIAAAVARRWGGWLGLLAGAIVASNPMVAAESRAVRGYSLLVACAVGSTLLLLAMRSAGAPTRRQRIGYTAVAAAGMATHLFMGPVLLAHLAVVVADRRRRTGTDPGSAGDADRITPVVQGVAIGVVPWLVMVPTMLGHGQAIGRMVHPSYPIDVAYQVLGGTLLAIALLTVTSAFGLRGLLGRREVVVSAAVIGAVGLVLWLVVAPGAVATRWFMWLVPIVAVVSARAVRDRRLLVVPALLAVAACSWAWVPTMTHSINSIPEAAHAVTMAQAAGHHTCVENVSVPSVLAVTRDVDPLVGSDDFARCAVLVSPFPELDGALTRAADAAYPYARRLHAIGEGKVWSRTPIPDDWLSIAS